jgi:hypothetical protein
MTGQERGPRRQVYEIRVRGHLGAKMLRAFPAFAARTRGEDTLLTGCLPDQAAVYGLIARLEALGLELVEFRLLPACLRWCRRERGHVMARLSRASAAPGRAAGLAPPGVLAQQRVSALSPVPAATGRSGRGAVQDRC